MNISGDSMTKDVTFTPEEVKKIFAKHSAEIAIKTAVITFVFTYIIFTVIHM